jgi:hypothetical protein
MTSKVMNSLMLGLSCAMITLIEIHDGCEYAMVDSSAVTKRRVSLIIGSCYLMTTLTSIAALCFRKH